MPSVYLFIYWVRHQRCKIRDLAWPSNNSQDMLEVAVHSLHIPAGTLQGHGAPAHFGAEGICLSSHFKLSLCGEIYSDSVNSKFAAQATVF